MAWVFVGYVIAMALLVNHRWGQLTWTAVRRPALLLALGFLSIAILSVRLETGRVRPLPVLSTFLVLLTPGALLYLAERVLHRRCVSLPCRVTAIAIAVVAAVPLVFVVAFVLMDRV